jgi:two-component system sensor histidine kinase AlgZ
MSKPVPPASDSAAQRSRPAGAWTDSTRPGVPRSSSLFGPTGFGMAPPGAAGRRPGEGSPFDVCHVGVALRTVLFVHGSIAVAVLFVSADLQAWLVRLAEASSAGLPAVLMWLISACMLNRHLIRLPGGVQWGIAIGLGAASSWVVHAMQFHAGLGMAGASGWWLPPVVGGGALAAAVFYWLSLRARARLPADTTARLAELQSRIRPHFLFNTLNTAIALARHDPARTEGLLEDLAELFRVALTETGESVTLSDEVALARRYLAIEQVRFGSRLQVTWELDDDAGMAKVPPLLLQPLVENAVRHGVEPSPEGGVIRIRTRVKRAHAVVSIANTLPGARSKPGNGMALHNVHERLKLMHDVSARFDVQSDGKVFRVQIVVPL